MELNDEALVQACRNGDASAWETLAARYRQLIYNLCRRSGLDGEQSAEVVQTVFAKLVEQLDDIREPAHIAAWLITITRRQALRLRYQEHSSTLSIDDNPSVSEAIPDSTPLPDEVILRQEEQHKVRMAVAALDERCRKLVTLLFYQASVPPYTELAAELGVVAGSIGPLRARCLKKLALLLEEQAF
jgi:RNA polymerase sigma factor (sigma-70 family)